MSSRFIDVSCQTLPQASHDQCPGIRPVVAAAASFDDRATLALCLFFHTWRIVGITAIDGLTLDEAAASFHASHLGDV